MDVVDVVDVVVVVDGCGELVDVVGEVTDGGALVSGGELVDVGGGEVDVDVGGGLVEVVDERILLGVDVVGEIVAQVWAGSKMVEGGASLETGATIVGGGAGTGALVVGGAVTWRTRWLRLDEDDMIATSVPATVAMATIMTSPTAIPTRGRSIVRERARRSPRERGGEGPVTSSILGGPASLGCSGGGSVPVSSAKNTKDGFVTPSSTVGVGTDAGEAAGADDGTSFDHGDSAPRTRTVS